MTTYYQYPANTFGGNYFNPNLMSNTSKFGNTSNPQVGNQIVQNPVQTNDGFNNMHVPVYNNSQIPGMYQDFYTNQSGQAHYQDLYEQNQIFVNQGQNQAIAQDRRMVQNQPEQHWYHHNYNQEIAQNHHFVHQQNQPLAYQQGQSQAMVQNHPDQHWDHNQAMAQNNQLLHQQNQPLAYQQPQNQAITQNLQFYNPVVAQNHQVPSRGIKRQIDTEPYPRKQQKVKNSKENCDFYCQPCGKWLRTDRHLKTCQKCK